MMFLINRAFTGRRRDDTISLPIALFTPVRFLHLLSSIYGR